MVEIRSRPNAPVRRRLFHRRSVRVRSPNSNVHTQHRRTTARRPSERRILASYTENVAAPNEYGRETVRTENRSQSFGRPRRRPRLNEYVVDEHRPDVATHTLTRSSRRLHNIVVDLCRQSRDHGEATRGRGCSSRHAVRRQHQHENRLSRTRGVRLRTAAGESRPLKSQLIRSSAIILVIIIIIVMIIIIVIITLLLRMLEMGLNR